MPTLKYTHRASHLLGTLATLSRDGTGAPSIDHSTAPEGATGPRLAPGAAEARTDGRLPLERAWRHAYDELPEWASHVPREAAEATAVGMWVRRLTPIRVAEQIAITFGVELHPKTVRRLATWGADRFAQHLGLKQAAA